MRMTKFALKTIITRSLLVFLIAMSGCQQQSSGVGGGGGGDAVSRYVEYQGRVCVRIIYFYQEGDQRSSSVVLDGRAQGRNCISYQPIGNIGDTVLAVIRGIDTYTCE